MPISSPIQPDAGDRDLVASAQRKQREDKHLSREELAALRRYRNKADEAARWHHYATIPISCWLKLTGKKRKANDHLAKLHGIPMLGSVIDLAPVVRWIHDFLSRNSQRLRADANDEAGLMSGNSSWAEEYRKQRALLARLDRRDREGMLVSCEMSRQAWFRIAEVLRRAGSMLEQQYGAAAGRLVNQAVESGDREINNVFPDRSTDPRDDAIAPDAYKAHVGPQRFNVQ